MKGAHEHLGFHHSHRTDAADYEPMDALGEDGDANGATQEWVWKAMDYPKLEELRQSVTWRNRLAKEQNKLQALARQGSKRLAVGQLKSSVVRNRFKGVLHRVGSSKPGKRRGARVRAQCCAHCRFCHDTGLVYPFRPSTLFILASYEMW